MNYKHLTINERACVYQLKQLGMSIRKIAEALDRSPSTISRELKRNFCGYKFKYLPHKAQEKYELRRTNCHRITIIDSDIHEYIETKINLHWSPDQIVNRKENDKPKRFPCISTIYRWIHLGLLPKVKIEHLRRKGNFRRPAETRGKFNIGKTIKKRPKEVFKRKTFGHWEADTVVSGKKNNYELKSKYCFVTLAERKSRLYLFKLIPDRKQETVTEAIIEMLSQLPKGLVQTITCDRGKEFAGWKTIEENLNTNIYFADPYCAWQKGTNENSNGLLREFFPKHMDLSEVTEDEVKTVTNLLNNRPRKCLNYNTPNELIDEYLLNCCT